MNINTRICQRDEMSVLVREEVWQPTATIYMPSPLNYALATKWIAQRFSQWAWVGPGMVEVRG